VAGGVGAAVGAGVAVGMGVGVAAGPTLDDVRVARYAATPITTISAAATGSR
jgi:hypothetical protein